MPIGSRFRSELIAHVLEASLAVKMPQQGALEPTFKIHRKLLILYNYLTFHKTGSVHGTDRETKMLDAETNLPLLLGP